MAAPPHTHRLAAAASDRLALRACRLFETRDIDEAQDRISRIMQPHRLRRQARGGAGRYHMDFLRLGGVGVGTIAFGPGQIEVPPLDGYHLVVFCLAGGAALQAGGLEVGIDRTRAVLCPAGTPLAGRFSADCEQLVLRIDRRRLDTFDGAARPRAAAAIDLRSPAQAPWLAMLRALVSDGPTVRLVQRDRAAAADFEQLLLRLLLAGPGSPRPLVRPGSVARAVAFMEAEAASPLTLADIAHAAGVPERTLQEAFAQFMGVSPMRHLRQIRLDRVRARLTGGEGVTAAALAEGFTHAGRFATAYAGRFGEKPSETGRKAS